MEKIRKGKREMFVYADNAATTSVSKTALDAMLPYLTEKYGNPSSLYGFAQDVKEGLDAARGDRRRMHQRKPQRDILHLRRKRGRQSGHSVRGKGRREEGKEAHHLHRV